MVKKYSIKRNYNGKKRLSKKRKTKRRKNTKKHKGGGRTSTLYSKTDSKTYSKPLGHNTRYNIIHKPKTKNLTKRAKPAYVKKSDDLSIAQILEQIKTESKERYPNPVNNCTDTSPYSGKYPIGLEYKVGKNYTYVIIGYIPSTGHYFVTQPNHSGSVTTTTSIAIEEALEKSWQTLNFYGMLRHRDSCGNIYDEAGVYDRTV
jgi:hypothetical protein